MRAAMIGFALLVGACASAPERAGPPPEIDANAPRWLAEHQVASVAIAYIENGRIAWTAAYGERAPGVPATAETPYNVASLAKPVSAETILRLASAGRVDLDAPMSAHWVDPDIANDPRSNQLTLNIALSHRTGFPNWRRMTDGVLRFQSDPGQGFTYSGEGYEYARRYTERAVGEDFERLAQTFVLDRVGARHTAYTQRHWFAEAALPYEDDNQPGEPSINEPGDMLASDDLYTTVSDYARFMIAVMNNEGVSAEIANRRLQYSFELRDEGCGPGGLAPEFCPLGVGMGLGWMVFRYDGDTVATHSGSDSGEQTIALFIPERRSGLVMFTNSAHGTKVFPEIFAQLYPGHPFVEVLRLQAG